MAMTEKQIAALSKVQNEGIVSIKGSVGLKDAGKQHLRTLAI